MTRCTERAAEVEVRVDDETTDTPSRRWDGAPRARDAAGLGHESTSRSWGRVRDLARASVMGVVAMLLAACLRAPLGDEVYHEGGTESGTDDDDGAMDVDEGADTTTGAPDPTCHASYVPCLPVVEDMNCDEVRALGAAPVQVVGDDVYGLDADNDGIGCE